MGSDHSEWKPARKKPVEIEYQGPFNDPSIVETIEGDFEVDHEYIDEHGGYVIIRGVRGEKYPCGYDIFKSTYEDLSIDVEDEIETEDGADPGDSMDLTVRLFRVLFDPERTRIEIDGDVMGWGVRFPSGWCYVAWNRSAYPEDDRLENPHVSIYGGIDDVEQGTGGYVEMLHTQSVSRYIEANGGGGE